MRMLVLIALLGVFVFSAAAADVSGKWVAQIPGRNGQAMETTFNLKADGAKLTGNQATARGETAISDGKVDGDTISFVVVMSMGGNEMKMNYTGKVAGDEIKFVRTREGADQKQEFTAKKGS